MNQVVMSGYTRINKTKARNMYNAGKTVYIQSSNFVPDGAWSKAIPMSLPVDSDGQGWNAYNGTPLDFDNRVRNFEWYNCPNTETGLYASFYIREGG